MIHINSKTRNIYVISLIVGMLNVLFSASKIMYGIIAVEIIFLLYKLIKKDFIGYLCYYVIFICLSMEFEVFVESEQLYSLKNIRFLGLNLGLWLLIPYGIAAILNYRPLLRATGKYKVFSKLGKWFLGMNFVAAFVGLIALLLNENNIWGMEGFFSAYYENAYSFLFQPFLLFWGFALAIKHNNKEISRIGTTLHAVLIGSIFMMITSLVSGISGQYGSVSTAASSLVSSFLCFLLLYPFMEKVKHRALHLAIGVVGVVLLLMYQQSGKLFIMLLLVAAIFLFQQLKGKSLFTKFIGMFCFIGGAIAVLFIMNYMGQQHNDLFNSKLYEAQEVLSFKNWNMEYFRKMDNSPRVRFGEFIDLFYEYLQKPWFILTGKGYGGTIRDWSGILYLTPEAERSAGFSLVEYANGTFFNVHEIVTPLLAFGLMGIIFFFKCFKYAWRNLCRNLWLLIGIYWLPMFYGYSFTIGIFGVVCLYYGFISCQEQDEIMDLRLAGP